MATPKAPLPPARIRLAWIVAAVADILQLALLPAFGGGFFSAFDVVLDAAVGILLTVLLGWNLAFLPTFIVELIPGVDLVPTWLVAVWIATRGRREPAVRK
ncbi:MAG TPA: hypothetical protein VJY35_03695 [Candidatus Eisenbacteria bacterium]|nr:hypothetical protein [Candidatus Eisenbacteria bacterium]